MQSISLEEKSIQTLELPAVLDRLSKQCVTATARESAEALRPAKSSVEIRKLLEETTAAKTMMVVRGSPSFSGVKDVRSSLSRADLGGALNTRELTDIAGVLQCARLVRRYVSDDSVGHTCIDYLFSALRANRPLEEKITSSIVGEDEIADGASSELADIRRKMRAAASRAREALNKIISSSSYAKALQEPIITMRSDRYVVPVKAEHKNAVPGLVHDISSSGATLFIEPMGAVKANNELRELAAREKLEIERILMELSAECAANREEISSDFEILTRLDLIFAKAKLSYDFNGMEPEITESNIILNHARHPLLPKDTAVPIDVSLGEDFDTLVITGPNTGGKTVTLKTIGLLCLMTKCGLHIPVDDGSKICVFDHVFADIGDEQSIEQNLSTFSAHMTNIVRILEECSDHSLILFDELGAGTDPTEGAALAISVIEHCRKKGAMIAATTHYAELKVYATEQKRVQNASCEFDVETLRPTYKLLVGIPGKSNAFAISTRLGLPSEIIDDAKSRIGTDSASFEATIEKLEQTRLSLEKEREDARRIRKQAEEDAKTAKHLKAELSVRLEKADERSRREAERIIEDARRAAKDVRKHFAEYKEDVDTFLADRDYLALDSFISVHDLYDNKQFREYSEIFSAVGNYTRIYQGLQQLAFSNRDTNYLYSLQTLSRNYNDFYEAMNGRHYSWTEDIEKTEAAVAEMEADLAVLVQKYLGLTKEETDSLRGLSDTKRVILLESAIDEKLTQKAGISLSEIEETAPEDIEMPGSKEMPSEAGAIEEEPSQTDSTQGE